MIKKISILLVIILMILITPKAYASNNLTIESITLKEKSENLIELSKPTINGMNLGFNLSYLNIGDKAKYEVIISNNTNKDYYIDNETKFNKSSYITYTYEFDEKVDKIKKNSKLKMYITIEYTALVPPQKLVNGMYTEENAMSMDLSDVILTNPSTYSNILVFILIIITLLVLTIIKISKKKKIGINLLLIGLLLIPITTYALEKITIKAVTKIVIEEQRNIIEYRYVNSYQSNTERDLWQYSKYIKSVTFETKIEEPSNYAYKFDVSEAKNNSIIAYLIQNEDPTYYDLYIMCNGYIYANPDSSYMFDHFIAMKNINNFENFQTVTATNMRQMFGFISSMEELDLSTFNTSNVTTLSCFLLGNSYDENTHLLRTIDLSSFDTSKVTNMSSMFSGCRSLTSIDLSNFDTSNVTDLGGMFINCISLKSIDLSPLDTSKVNSLSSMFAGCWSLENIDLSPLDTRNVISMGAMFSGCTSLKSIDLSPLNTNKVTNMGSMFDGCRSLESIDLSPLNTSNVTNMQKMFHRCSSLKTIDLSPLDTSKVEDMSYMLSGCTSLTTIDLSPLNTSNVKDMQGLFYGCSSLNEIKLDNIDTSIVLNMNKMFYEYQGTTLDISSFNTSNVREMESMFYNSPNLETILVGSNWTVDQVSRSQTMFKYCTKLPNFDPSKLDKTNANTSPTGYLTLKS